MFEIIVLLFVILPTFIYCLINGRGIKRLFGVLPILAWLFGKVIVYGVSSFILKTFGTTSSMQITVLVFSVIVSIALLVFAIVMARYVKEQANQSAVDAFEKKYGN